MMRIITGKARGVKLRTLEGEITRPTAERTKEAVFSMLQFEIEGKRVLDGFAGSGQLGLEALSRGASFAMFVDKNKASVDVIKKNVELTRMVENSTVICSELEPQLEKMAGGKGFDIVFLDPPYKSDLIDKSLKCLVRCRLLSRNAIVVCESGGPIAIEADTWFSDNFNILRSAKYGIAYVTILRLKDKELEQI